MKDHLKKWVLATDGWKLPGSDKTYDIFKLDEMIEKAAIVTYSIKYMMKKILKETKKCKKCALFTLTQNPAKSYIPRLYRIFILSKCQTWDYTAFSFYYVYFNSSVKVRFQAMGNVREYSAAQPRMSYQYPDYFLRKFFP